MSMWTVRHRAFTGGEYKYGNWTVKNRQIYYKGTLVASVRIRIRRSGVWFEVTIINFDRKCDVISGKNQTLAAIERVTHRISHMTEFNGIEIDHYEEWYVPEEKRA